MFFFFSHFYFGTHLTVYYLFYFEYKHIIYTWSSSEVDKAGTEQKNMFRSCRALQIVA